MGLNYFTPFLSRFRLGLTLAVVLAASGNLSVAEAAGVGDGRQRLRHPAV